MSVISDWNRLPSDFNLCDPDEDLIFMSAFTMAKSKMQAYQRDQEIKEAETRRKKAQRYKGKSR